jgi:polyferredoxin
LLLRPDLEVSVLHDRNPIWVKLSDGGLRNGYTLKLLNKLYEPRSFKLRVQGLRGAKLTVVGQEHEQAPVIKVAPDQLESIRAYVAVDKAAYAALTDATTEFFFTVTDTVTGAEAEHKANFQGPER